MSFLISPTQLETCSAAPAAETALGIRARSKFSMPTHEESATVERGGGLFSSLGEPESIRHLQKFIRDTGLMSPDEQEWFAPYLVETQGPAGDFVRDAARRLRDFLNAYDAVPVESQEGFITVAVNELHCPRVEGASARLTVKAEQGRKETCGIKIFGIGGGDEFSITVQAREVLETAGRCVATVHMLPAVFERCVMNTPDSRQVSFVRLREVQPRNLITKGQVLEGDEDACNAFRRHPELDGETETVDISDFASAKLTKGLTVEYGSTWKAESGVKLDKLGLDVTAEYEASKSYTTELEYTLAEGYRYVSLKPADRASWLWRWSRGA